MNDKTRLLHGLKTAKHLIQLFEADHLGKYTYLFDEINLDDGRKIVWSGKEMVEHSRWALDTAIAITKNTFGGGSAPRSRNLF